MRLRSGKVKEKDSNLDNHVNITQSLFDDTEIILEESPISSHVENVLHVIVDS